MDLGKELEGAIADPDLVTSPCPGLGELPLYAFLDQLALEVGEGPLVIQVGLEDPPLDVAADDPPSAPLPGDRDPWPARPEHHVRCAGGLLRRSLTGELFPLRPQEIQTLTRQGGHRNAAVRVRGVRLLFYHGGAVRFSL